MAGDWIKMRCGIADEPEVIGVASLTGLDEDTVVGKLHRLWCWADQKCSDGNAAGVTERWVDRYVNCEGFASALMEVGWLEIHSKGIRIPKFDRHMGQSAKRRALTSNRVADYRKKKGSKRNAGSVNNGVTREEKSREEKRVKNPPKKHRPTFDEVSDYAKSRGRPDLAKAFFDYYEAGDWFDSEGKPVRSWKQKFIAVWEGRDKSRLPKRGTDSNEDAANEFLKGFGS